VAQRIGAGEHGQAEGERDAEQADAQRVAVPTEVRGQHRAAAASEDEPERAEELGGKSFDHWFPPCSLKS